MDIEVRSQAFYLDLAVILMNYRVHKTDTYAGSKHPTGERKLAKKFFNDEILPKLVEVAKVDALRRDILLAFIIEGMVERVIWP